MRIHHIAMRTVDVARLEAFYTEGLGLPVVQRDGARSVWLRAGDALLMIEAAEESEPVIPPGSRELVAFGIQASDLARSRRSLAAHAITIEAETAYTIYFRDPDGRRIGLSHYPVT